MRKADIGFALLLLALAALVAWESLKLDIGWGLNGPQGGFFPFWLAVGLGACCLIILAQTLWNPSPAMGAPLVKPGGWVPILKVAVPATAMVALTGVIGLYAAAALYIGFYMRWIGKHHWLLILAVSVGVPLASYVIFDKWFLIPMPKGWWGEHLSL
ncbi:MAG TPA: tripartite tricarboxylate transporter TctB family protein [Candidatus Tectomicrobia bacterium]|nr:tripartite tricarboxylate transporter TctB family protein [Candidatus Tectomicrobia bacterium]